MIKVEIINKSKSYWRSDSLYDNEHQKNIIIKLFGLTIWNKTDNMKCDLVDYNDKTGIGFKK